MSQTRLPTLEKENHVSILEITVFLREKEKKSITLLEFFYVSTSLFLIYFYS